ncbi:MAG TPA: peptidoglycan editing factor PgeF [Burkholderiales bacterium]|nr:peptidoglycan editing factor PgeF [Burkholderiales bacterium]
MNIPADWIIPDWPAPVNVKGLITTRRGGISSGPYASCNLGLHAGDDAAAVAANRRRLRELLPAEPKWLEQVHGNRVVAADGLTETAAADASVARQPGTVCAVMMADCLPVLLCDRDGSVVGIAHAGWRGLAAGVIENTVGTMALPPQRLLAWLGPAIGPAAFEVGAEVRDAFVTHDPAAAAAFVPSRQTDKWRADLYALARQRLARCGVAPIYGGGLCTASDPARFYSHRRDRVTGRMAALIWLAPGAEKLTRHL